MIFEDWPLIGWARQKIRMIGRNPHPNNTDLKTWIKTEIKEKAKHSLTSSSRASFDVPNNPMSANDFFISFEYFFKFSVFSVSAARNEIMGSQERVTLYYLIRSYSTISLLFTRIKITNTLYLYVDFVNILGFWLVSKCLCQVFVKYRSFRPE